MNNNGRNYDSYNPQRTENRPYTPDGGGKKPHKKRRVRVHFTKDGLIALAELLLIILVVALVIILIIKGITARNKKPSETTTSATTTVTTPEEKPKWTAGFTTANIDTASFREGNLVLVNSENEYIFPSKMQSKLTSLYDIMIKNRVFSLRDSGMEISRTIANQLVRLCEDMIAANPETLGEYKSSDGTTVSDKILISSGYRTKEYQQSLYENSLKDESDDVLVARAGFSEHHTGLAIDIKIFTGAGKTVDLRTGEYIWMTENCHKYGFVRRYDEDKFDLTGISGEEWHFRFVDIPHAQVMKEKEMCLEEYLAYIKTCTPDTAPLEVGTDRGDFLIYYVPADKLSDITYVPVPKDAKKITDSFASTDKIESGMYTVSGDNAGGFIITLAK